jgi:single-strand DNA-binding protein
LGKKEGIMSVNKVILVGRLGADPELKYTNSGNPVCNFSIATNERWYGDDGVKSERVTWHKITSWGALAQNCEKYLSKGREVYIEGRLQTRSYDNSDGVTIYIVEVVALNIVFLGVGQRIESEDEAA